LECGIDRKREMVGAAVCARIYIYFSLFCRPGSLRTPKRLCRRARTGMQGAHFTNKAIIELILE
jgi:hypothetical protein